MDNLKILKWINIIGGIYEIIFGVLLIFWIQDLLKLLGVFYVNINFPIFNQTAGLLAIIFGILLITSAIDVERYLLIPIVSIILRFAIQFVIFPNIPVIPEMTIGLISFAIVDLIFGVITLIMVKKCGFSIKTLSSNNT